MKIIYDNIIFSTVKQGGVSNYWFELSKFLLEQKEDFWAYEEKGNNNNFHRNQLSLPQERILISPNSPKSSILKRLAPVRLKEKEKFLFHSSYYRPLTGSKNYTEVTTVHDFTHNLHSNFYKRNIHNLLKYRSIKRAKGIICISDNTYKDLHKFCPPKKNQNVVVIHNGVSDDFFVINPLDIMENEFLFEKQSYILYVGGRQQYKNFSFVIDLLKADTQLNLVVVGDEFRPKELQYIGTAKNRITVLKNVSNYDLNLLYNDAKVFVYPSSYEGFGIPVIESMKAGCPVIALNSSSIPEICGDAGILLDKLDVGHTLKIINGLNNESFRQELIEKGVQQAKKYSWEKCCRETLEFYKETF
jgi:glycosyltransferase involved in cell wall biosynthesis